jgi:hypothetical protein
MRVTNQRITFSKETSATRSHLWWKCRFVSPNERRLRARTLRNVYRGNPLSVLSTGRTTDVNKAHAELAFFPQR